MRCFLGLFRILEGKNKIINLNMIKVLLLDFQEKEVVDYLI